MKERSQIWIGDVRQIHFSFNQHNPTLYERTIFPLSFYFYHLQDFLLIQLHFSQLKKLYSKIINELDSIQCNFSNNKFKNQHFL